MKKVMCDKYLNVGKYVCIILIFLIVKSSMCYAQTRAINPGDYTEYIPNVFPPSPTAFKFSNHGNIPVNGSTGAFSYSIPIYAIKDKDLTLPISLDYNSNGVRIDELSGIVGTDWVLNAGGIISRVVRGEPDENSKRWFPEYINPSTDAIKAKIYAIAANQSAVDIEQDWFSFNINGISGNFYFDENLNIVLNSKEYVKITMNKTGTGTYGDMMSFTITDNRGYSYIFGGTDNYLEGSDMSSSNAIGPKNIRFYSSWFLKTIISPSQNRIDFFYTNNYLDYYSGTYFSLIYEQDCICNGIVSETYTGHYTPSIQRSRISSKVISEIRFSSGSVWFNYNTNRADGGGMSLKDITLKKGASVIKKIALNYETVFKSGTHPNEYLKSDKTLQYRLFLKDILFLNTVGVSDEKYSFEYNDKEKLPIRLSFSKDLFGYNNGFSNSTPFSSKLKDNPEISTIIKRHGYENFMYANLEVNPDRVYHGMLSKIIYPTGGYTKINYEANSTTNVTYERVYKNHGLRVLKDCSTAINKDVFTFVATNSTKIEFQAAGYLFEMSGCMTPTPDRLHDKYYLSIRDLTTNQLLLSESRAYGTVLNSDELLANKQVTTKVGHKYEIEFELGSKIFNTATGYSSIKYDSESVLKEVPSYGGGARVSNIEDYDIDGKCYNKRRFYYNQLSKYPSTESSLIKVFDPKYYYSISYPKNCANACTKYDPYYKYKRVSISSSTNNSLYNNRKQAAYYTVITEFRESNNESNGAIERSFYDVSDSYANMIQGPEIMGTPYTNRGEGYYGLMKEEKLYKKESNKYILAQKKEWSYNFNHKTLSSYMFRKNYEFLGRIPGAPGTNIDNISIALYYNWAGITKLSWSSESIYNLDGVISTKTTNTYGKAPYYNLISQEMFSSAGDIRISKNQYAPDLVGELSHMDKLVSANMVAIPIIQEAYKKESANDTEKLISQLKTTYKYPKIKKQNGTTVSMLLPEAIYTLNNTSSKSVSEKRISFDRYDEYGNVTEYTVNDASKVVQLWSYKGYYPIAEINNITYEEVKNILGEDLIERVTIASEPPVADLNAINNLRSNTEMAKASITTYTYKPLIGVSTITDPSGKTVYYDYDDFGRLKKTYIKNGSADEILEVYEYNYVNK